MNQPLPPLHSQPFGLPQFSPEAAQKRRGRGLAKAIGVVLLVIAIFGFANDILSVSMLFGGTKISMDWLPGMTPEMKREMEESQQAQIDLMYSRWSFWTFTGCEFVITLITLVAGIWLLKGKTKGIGATKLRVALALLSLPLWGYETMAIIDLMSQRQDQMMEIQIRAAKGADPVRAREALDRMKPAVKALTYGSVILSGIFIVIVNGVIVLLVTRPQVREYLELAESGGDNDLPVHFDAAMGLPMMPPSAWGQGPGGETVHMPPPK
ncbi:hypothetical protein PLCT2_02699 [Planctomycetaceae bacterium]|nr:hypothetical protein PLCT2_02699 [Planctomycetaceae bacterium]